MINTCEKFFDHQVIKISTDSDVKKTKTKVLAYGADLTPLVLGTKQLPYVSSWQHLGHTMSTDESYLEDMNARRQQFIGKFYSLQQDLGEQDPSVMFTLIRVYLLHMYGCVLWDIHDDGMTKLWTASICL